MVILFQSLVARCELSVRRDGKGVWQLSAKGPLAVVGVLVVLVIYHFAS